MVAVGGDGSLSEVVNGVMQHRQQQNQQGGSSTAIEGISEAAVGVIPSGTGSDFRRTLGLPADAKQALALLHRPGALRTMPMDVCRLSCHDEAGQEVRRHFVNVCSAGASAEAAPLIARRRWLGGTLAYSLCAAQALLCMQRRAAEVRLDGGEWLPVPRLTLVAIGNGRYFGGGIQVRRWDMMCLRRQRRQRPLPSPTGGPCPPPHHHPHPQICPLADPRSGSLAVTIVDGLGLADFLRHQGKLRRGQLDRVPRGVTQLTAARTVELRLAGLHAARGATLPVEADGETVGWAPLRVDLLPGALLFADCSA